MIVAWLTFAPAFAQADTLRDVLAEVYLHNPAISAEREKLAAAEEQLPEARANWKPTVNVEGDAGVSHQTYDTTSGSLRPVYGSVAMTLPVYRGGRTVAATSQAESNIAGERARLMATEQNVLVNASQAYLDLLEDQTILDLQKANEKTLNDWVHEAGERFRLQEKTRTDVSLFESRLARAEGDRATALINLGVARSAYFRFVGMAPGAMSRPNLLVSLPDGHDRMMEEAVRNAPDVLAAYFDLRSQEANVDAVRGVMLPEVNIQGTASNGRDENVPEQFIDSNRSGNDQLVLQVKIPLYAGGGNVARLREAFHQRGEKRFDYDETSREAVERAEQAWEQYQATSEVIAVRGHEVKAAGDALKGMKIEERMGDRSSIDTLDAEQDLLNAQVGEAQAVHDHTLALIQLSAAIGRFTADRLHLAVEPQAPEVLRHKVRKPKHFKERITD